MNNQGIENLNIGDTAYLKWWTGYEAVYKKGLVENVTRTGQVRISVPKRSMDLRFMANGREIGRGAWSSQGWYILSKDNWDEEKLKAVEVSNKFRAEAITQAKHLITALENTKEITAQQCSNITEILVKKVKGLR